jgi:hypothetical protein
MTVRSPVSIRRGCIPHIRETPGTALRALSHTRGRRRATVAVPQEPVADPHNSGFELAVRRQCVAASRPGTRDNSDAAMHLTPPVGAVYERERSGRGAGCDQGCIGIRVGGEHRRPSSPACRRQPLAAASTPWSTALSAASYVKIFCTFSRAAALRAAAAGSRRAAPRDRALGPGAYRPAPRPSPRAARARERCADRRRACQPISKATSRVR